MPCKTTKTPCDAKTFVRTFSGASVRFVPFGFGVALIGKASEGDRLLVDSFFSHQTERLKNFP